MPGALAILLTEPSIGPQGIAIEIRLSGPDLETKPIGKPFEEVYDVVNVVPTAEWQGMYDEVWEELVGMGLPLDSLV